MPHRLSITSISIYVEPRMQRAASTVEALTLTFVVLISSPVDGQPLPSLFAADPFPGYEESGDIREVGPWACGELKAPPGPAVPIPGEWLALAERNGQWVLEETNARYLFNGAIETTSPGARFILAKQEAFVVGPVQAATVAHDPGEDIVTFGDRTWKLRPTGYLLALEQGPDRWWLTPRTQEELAAFQARDEDKMPQWAWGVQCVNGSCPNPEIDTDVARTYGIVWAGDLDADNEPDFIFNWSHIEVFGYTLGVSRDPPTGAALRLVATLWDGCS